jgi:hypothetical protein
VSWFPALLPTGSDDGPQERPGRTVSFYAGLVELPAETLLACWAGQPQLEDSRFGSVTGAADFVDYVRASREWLALSDAVADPVSLVTAGARCVEEVALQLEVAGERQDLGAAVVTEWDPSCRLTSVRVYHSTSPLPGAFAHLPVLPPDEPPALPGFVAELERARAAREVDAVLEGYEADAEVRSFDGTPALLRGRDQLRRLYAVPEVAGRSTTTTVCTVTDDGRACAVEYLRGHGDMPAPDEAGLTTYVRGPGGRIAVERRYRVPTSAGTSRSARSRTWAPAGDEVRPLPRAVVPASRDRSQAGRAAAGEVRRAADG